MENLWFYLVVLPGVFLLGRLSSSVKITGFRAKVISSKAKEREFTRQR
ncbi:hypothetical protein [Hazenella coriacea]|uniref:Uncharacterized protein n=1 Tax=Hazenella coriacea TaxID=1179467 RepID=A0A4R3L7E1_9BACL|nr:hypothetical protein [Hazenella coriacea]TCS93406.1 hypothetical protein EDD58_10753 [Hazenella coriacea]